MPVDSVFNQNQSFKNIFYSLEQITCARKKKSAETKTTQTKRLV